jgi:hypothetical protein
MYLKGGGKMKKILRVLEIIVLIVGIANIILDIVIEKAEPPKVM